MQLFVKALTVIDFSYLCPIRGVLGESWIADIILDGALDDQNMVLDFGLVKKKIKTLIDEHLDHKLAIPVAYDGVSIKDSESKENHKVVSFVTDEQTIKADVAGPACSFAELTVKRIDEKAVAEFLQSIILPELPDNVKGLTIELRPEAINGFYYHYSHGLKKHDGNCQRIVHGHRSTIEIKENNMRSPRLNKFIADRWEDIYLGSEEDVVAASQLEMISAATVNQDTDVCFKYTATQGEFELVISKAVTEVLPCDTTVECLAEFLLHELHAEHPEKHYHVMAFEGVGKGAMFSSDDLS